MGISAKLVSMGSQNQRPLSVLDSSILMLLIVR